MNETLIKIATATALVAPLALAFPVVAAVPGWDTTGNYVVNMNYLGSDYAHDVSLAQADNGTLTGNGGSPAGANVYTWVITSGAVSGNDIHFVADYTATADAVIPQTTLHATGTIAANGTISGTWTDNYQGGARSGTFTTVSGAALALGSLAAEDFGVVNYDTGLGQLKGYSAGFGLTDATFEDVQSVVVRLYSGATLLQTNTATAKVGNEITGTQISSPFDVSGNFDYVTDGYWVNVREAEYGQSVPATRVVATVTLANGKVVTAENTTLSGDPTTIYPPAADTTPDAFSFIDQTGVATSTVVVSNQITVDGINASSTISVAGGEYSINGGAYTALAGTVVDGDTVRVRHTSSATANTSVNTTLTIGGVADTFTSTTLLVATDTTPDSFSFIDQINVATSTVTTSNQITVSGINASTTISVMGGEYSVNGGGYTTVSGTVMSGDTVRVRHTSSAMANTSVNTTLTIGGVADIFTSTTVSVVTPPVTGNKNQCKSGGWTTFTNPSFKNQGQCVSYFARQQNN